VKNQYVQYVSLKQIQRCPCSHVPDQCLVSYYINLPHIWLTKASPAGFLTSFIRSQYTKLPAPDTDVTGQVIIVTGANVGLGLEVARHFTRLNAAKVILGCRSMEKGEVAKMDIEVTTGRKGIVEVWKVDLNSHHSVEAFCQQAGALERLDVVVENAGIAIPTYEEVEGMESTIQVNVIATFLMALLFLPILRASAMKHSTTPHLVIVASDAHFQVSLHFVSQTTCLLLCH
jgi:retinol dehydrogenase-12